MKMSGGARRVCLLGASILILGMGTVFAGQNGQGQNGQGQNGQGQNGQGGGFGHHPTLPVPSVLVFGGLAVGAAVVAARARKKRDPSSEDVSK
jgi:hypothetical protein